MEDALTFGAWLKRRRGGLGLTQKELAQQIGYAEVTLRKVEADEARPLRQMAEKLAEALQIREEERARFVRFARQQSAADDAALPEQELPLPAADVRRLQAAPAVSEPVDHSPRLKLVTASTQIDWGEAPDVSRFHGRQAAVEQLRQWLADDQCRLVAVLGFGGIGKTDLATVVSASVQEQYSSVVWRSLRNAPPWTNS
jgi:transcriptional regulator with XRE-family HTH domain